jgi:predicted MFS family arabinose efflux permease
VTGSTLAEAPADPSPSPRRALTAALVAQVAVSVSEQGLPVLTGFIKRDLALSAAVAGVLVGAVPAGKAIGSYAAGAAVDRVGERRVLAIGAMLFGALVLAATAAPFAALLALLVVGGLFAATATPAGGKLVLLSFPVTRRGLAMGVRQTGIPLGGLVAALLLPWLAGAWGWRTGLVAAGLLTIAGGAAALAMAGMEPRVRRSRGGGGRRRPRPSGRFSRDRDLLLLTLWGCMMVGGQYVLIAFLPLHVHEGGGISLAAAALWLVSIVQVGGVLGRIAWGSVSDRLLGGRRRPLLAVISGIGAAGFLALALLPADAPVTAFGVAGFLGGISVIGWQGMFITGLAEIAGPRRAGAATGFALTFVSIGIAASPPLFGLVADLAGSYEAMWLALAIVVALSLVPALLVREPSEGPAAA